MSRYSSLSQASLTCEYLHSNSTTHEFLFGALVELVDNSRDAKAQNLQIYTDRREEFRGSVLLNFLDDGVGMDPVEVKSVIQFGKSIKKDGTDHIGQYGNGLKSGSMRIGKDMILFTKKNTFLSVLFLSRTFIESEKISETVFVPMPSFFEADLKPWLGQDNPRAALEKHNLELDIIYKYSPYKSFEELMQQFNKISSSSGTLVTIYNLKLLEDGSPELDFDSDPEDILMSNLDVEYERKSQDEHRSFRSYVSILYLDPAMRVFIQNKKVLTKRFDRTLYLPRMYNYKSNRFKVNAEKAKTQAAEEVKTARENLRDAEASLNHFSTHKMKTNTYNQDELTKLKRQRDRAREEVENKEKLLERKARVVNSPKQLSFIFGININNRNADGLFLYNCNRLILMFEHTKRQKTDKEYRGMVGIVNVPYLLLEPTHNKQQFTDQNELKRLISVMSDCMDQYYLDVNTSLDKDFWVPFGYFTNAVELPSSEKNYKRTRLQYVRTVLQCNRCLKWRELLWNSSQLQPDFPGDEWNCTMNTDPEKTSCQDPEFLTEYKQAEYLESMKRPETNFAQLDKQSANGSNKNALMMQNKAYAVLFQKENNQTVSKSIPPQSQKQVSKYRTEELLRQVIDRAREKDSSKSNKLGITINEVISTYSKNDTYTESDSNKSKRSNQNDNNDQMNKKRRTNYASESEEENYNRKKDRDPTYNPHSSRSLSANNLRTKKKASREEPHFDKRSDLYDDQTSSNDNNYSSQEQNDNYEIETNLAAETEIAPVKAEPMVNNDSGLVTTSSNMFRHSLESSTNGVLGHDTNRLGVSSAMEIKSLQNLALQFKQRYQNSLIMMAQAMNNETCMQEISQYNEEQLLDMSLSDFLEKFSSSIREQMDLKIRKKVRQERENIKSLVQNRKSASFYKEFLECINPKE